MCNTHRLDPPQPTDEFIPDEKDDAPGAIPPRVDASAAAPRSVASAASRAGAAGRGGERKGSTGGTGGRARQAGGAHLSRIEEGDAEEAVQSA